MLGARRGEAGSAGVLRGTLAVGLSLATVLGGVPATALAEAAGEAAAAREGVATSVRAEIVVAPEPVGGLAYDGTEQVGVPEGEGYELSGITRATEAGDYTATATPAEGFTWEDGTTAPVEVRWTIARRPAPMP